MATAAAPKRQKSKSGKKSKKKKKAKDKVNGSRVTFESAGYLGEDAIGYRISVFWEGTGDGDKWYDGVIEAYDASAEMPYRVKYDDGDIASYDLGKIKYRVLDNLPPKPTTAASGGSAGDGKRVRKGTGKADREEQEGGKEQKDSSGSKAEETGPGKIDAEESDKTKEKEMVPHPPPPEEFEEEQPSANTLQGATADKVGRTLSMEGVTGLSSLGRRIQVFWEDEAHEDGGVWYTGEISDFRSEDNKYFVKYDDGEEQWLELGSIKHRIVDAPALPLSPLAGAIPIDQKTDSPRAIAGAIDEEKVGPSLEDVGKRGRSAVNLRIAVWWEDDDGVNGRFEEGKIVKYDVSKRTYVVKYDDGDEGRHDLSNIRYYIIQDEEVGAKTEEAQQILDSKFSTFMRDHSELDIDKHLEKQGLKSEHLPGVVEDDGEETDSKDAESNEVSRKIQEMREKLKEDAARLEAAAAEVEDTHAHALLPRLAETSAEQGESDELSLLDSAEIPACPTPARRDDVDALLNLLDEQIDNPDEAIAGEKSETIFIDEFDRDMPEKELVIGALSLRDVELQERRLEDHRLETMREEVLTYRRREEALALQEEKARMRVLLEADRRQDLLDERHMIYSRRLRRREAALRRTFERKADRLRANLEEQQGTVTHRLGTLQEREDHKKLSYSIFKVRWNRVPQPIEFNIQLLRAVRDRLPNGKYVFLLTLYDRLGGTPLHWTELGLSGAGVGMPGATEPVHHQGRYYDVEMHVNKCCFTLCPSQRDVRPTLTYVIEVFQTFENSTRFSDRVVAWTAMPAVDVRSQLVKGKFRLPLLRGEVDKSIDRYQSFQKAYELELDRWLCNMYVEIVPRSREKALQGTGAVLREREVEMDYTRQLLHLRNPGDNEKEMLVREHVEEVTEERLAEEESEEQSLLAMADKVHAQPAGKSEYKSAAQKALEKRMRKKKKREEEQGAGGASKRLFGGYKPPAAARGARGAKLGEQHLVASSNAFAHESPEQGHSVDLRELEKYQYAIYKRGEKTVGHSTSSPAVRRMVFMYYELADEFRVRRWATLEFWLALLSLVIAFYSCIYMHSIGQYLYLRICGVTVFRFDPTAYGVILKYISSPLPVHMELGTVVAGQIFNLAFFSAVMLIAWSWRRLLGSTPDVLSKFLLGYGLGTVLDPVIHLVLDWSLGNFNCTASALCASSFQALECTCFVGDAFKLPERFMAVEGSPIAGILLTVLAHAIVSCASLIIFSNFCLFVFANGKIWDLYWRLASTGYSFFVPEDMELSAGEMRWICSKSARWRGPRGERRRVGVVEYTVTDPLFPKMKPEVTTHLAIYTVSDKMERSLYRHFVRSNDGTIIEVFGDVRQAVKAKYAALESVLIQAGKEKMAAYSDKGIFDVPSNGAIL